MLLNNFMYELFECLTVYFPPGTPIELELEVTEYGIAETGRYELILARSKNFPSQKIRLQAHVPYRNDNSTPDSGASQPDQDHTDD